MNNKQKRTLLRILSAFVLMIVASLLPATMPLLRFMLFMVAYLTAGGDVLIGAVRGLVRGHMLDEQFLMSVATVGAFFVGDYAEGVAVMLFYQVGELFQSYAVGRSRQSISALMDIRPDYANLLEGDSSRQVSPEEVPVGAYILVRPGEKIPLDGIVTEGSSAVDTAALTGESMPREITAGDSVISGCINLSGLLTVRVEQVFGESTVSKILDLVENASEKKAPAEQFITRFARLYTPLVVGAALLLALLPPLLFGQPFSVWGYRALTFLVISCPCALVVSIPMTFFGGIGAASRQGILVKGGAYLEALAHVETVAFDKTGTLTMGAFQVSALHPVAGISEQKLLEIAAHVEAFSTHPISRSICEAYGAPPALSIEEVRELAGMGVTALVGGLLTAAGNLRLMEHLGIDNVTAAQENETMVYLAQDGRYIGCIEVSDRIKPGAADTVRGLRALGVRQLVMLTGDLEAAGQQVARTLELDAAYCALLPAGKVEQVERLLVENSPKGKLLFVGDGVNDAPVLARADIGAAMGGIGSQAAIEAADLVIMDDDPTKLTVAVSIARRTLAICQQNVWLSIGVKVVVLVLGSLGFADMWAAVFADVGVSVLAILNAMRVARSK